MVLRLAQATWYALELSLALSIALQVPQYSSGCGYELCSVRSINCELNCEVWSEHECERLYDAPFFDTVSRSPVPSPPRTARTAPDPPAETAPRSSRPSPPCSPQRSGAPVRNGTAGVLRRCNPDANDILVAYDAVAGLGAVHVRLDEQLARLLARHDHLQPHGKNTRRQKSQISQVRMTHADGDSAGSAQS